MRTRVITHPSSGDSTATWSAGDLTAGQAGAVLKWTSELGVPTLNDAVLGGPGVFTSAQFGMGTPGSTLRVALDALNGDPSAVLIELQAYHNFDWVTIDTAILSAAGADAATLADSLNLLRLRVSVRGRLSAHCVALLTGANVPQAPDNYTVMKLWNPDQGVMQPIGVFGPPGQEYIAPIAS